MGESFIPKFYWKALVIVDWNQIDKIPLFKKKYINKYVISNVGRTVYIPYLK